MIFFQIKVMSGAWQLGIKRSIMFNNPSQTGIAAAKNKCSLLQHDKYLPSPHLFAWFLLGICFQTFLFPRGDLTSKRAHEAG